MFVKFIIGLCLLQQILCQDQPKIIIVGAGVSGIAAATKLLKNGFTDIKILEAQNKIGGRVSSAKIGDAYVDLGAEFCHGEEGNPIWPMVKDLDVVEHSNFKVHLVGSDGNLVDKEFSDVLKNITDEYGDYGEKGEFWNVCEGVLKMSDCLKKIYKRDVEDRFKDDKERSKLLEPGLQFLEATVNSYESSFDWNDVRSETVYTELKGDTGWNWKGKGYKTFLDILMEKYPDKKGLPVEEKVEFGKEVTEISLANKSITVKTKDGSTYSAHNVIFTPSVGVLKDQHKSLFTPELPPEKVKAINGIGFGAVVKVVLRFDEKLEFHSEDSDHICSYFWTKEDVEKVKEEFPDGLTKDGKAWVANIAATVTHRRNPSVVTVWIGGEHVPYIEALPKDVVVNGTMYTLKKFALNHAKVGEPVESIVTQWKTNPFTRGSWTYESMADPLAEEKLPNKLAAPISGSDGICMVHFAGEATSLHNYGTVGGAMEAGYREADRIIDMYKKHQVK